MESRWVDLDQTGSPGLCQFLADNPAGCLPTSKGMILDVAHLFLLFYAFSTAHLDAPVWFELVSERPLLMQDVFLVSGFVLGLDLVSQIRLQGPCLASKV